MMKFVGVFGPEIMALSHGPRYKSLLTAILEHLFP